MRLAAFALRLVGVTGAAVYLYDPELGPSNLEPQTLSPVAARGVLAQRAGVFAHHASDLSGQHAEELLEALNNYGVRTPLAATADAPRRALLLLENSDDVYTTSAFLASQTLFSLDSAPSLADAQNLVIDLARQAEPRWSKMSDEEAIRMLNEEPTITTAGDYFFLAADISRLDTAFKRMVDERSHITTVLLDNKTGNSSFSWGTYTMPAAQSPLLKREDAPALPAALVRQDTNYNGSLRGILPSCFNTMNMCQSATQNCTGHGQCVRKYTDKSRDAEISCYSCQCSITQTTNENGRKKTTYWGGPACQKRDVSTPFWLLALFTVGMMFLVGFGIGQIWSMGEEELPSVIGAGVSGPVKRS